MPSDDATETPVTCAGIAEMLCPHGLSLRGGFFPGADEDVPGASALGGSRTLLLIGVIGDGIWSAFKEYADDGPNPLDDWTRGIVDSVARDVGGVSVYPNDKPFWPFQQWAQRSEPVFQSPIGLLIHPDYGLWHAYRGVLVVRGRLDLPAKAKKRSPCDTCSEKPCLSACPVGAFSPVGYDVPKCADHLRAPQGGLCLSGGCQARNACPVGVHHRYPGPQVRFHMGAFNRTINRR